MPTILFSAGDPSGDAHAAELIRALKRKDPSIDCVGLGGPAMRAAGMELLEDLTVAAAIGPFDAARHLAVFSRARKRFAECLARRKPDLAVLVDFGDFHLPFIAPLASAARTRVAYYISPQIWAWGRWRLGRIRAHVSRMIVFFPFEEAFYRKAGIPVTWVGHPMVEQTRASLSLQDARARWSLNPARMTVGLLPGSRRSEISRHLGLMLDSAARIADQMPGVQFLIPVAPGLDRQSFADALRGSPADARLSDGPLPDALQLMDAALVCSGTATLETALAGVPMAVVYRTSWPTYLAAKLVVRIPHIALANVVAGGEIVTEFVQAEAKPETLSRAIVGLLRDAAARRDMIRALGAVKEQLGEPGAAERAADAVLAELKSARG